MSKKDVPFDTKKGDFMNFIYHFTFIIVTIFVLIKTISYGLYEIKTQNNKSGGIAVICFAIVVVIFTNIISFLR